MKIHDSTVGEVVKIPPPIIFPHLLQKTDIGTLENNSLLFIEQEIGNQ